MILGPAQHITGHGAACPGCVALREHMLYVEGQICTCPAGALRGGLYIHLLGCPAEPFDWLRIRLAGHGASVPDGCLIRGPGEMIGRPFTGAEPDEERE